MKDFLCFGRLPDTRIVEFRPFWDGTQAKQLRLPRCTGCKRFNWYPQPMCPRCRSLGYDWVPVSGKGKLFSYTVVRRPFLQESAGKVPFIVVLVALDDCPYVRFVSNLIHSKPEEIYIGMPVEVVFMKASDEVTLPFFRRTEWAEI